MVLPYYKYIEFFLYAQARLKFESKQKDDRNAQLRSLLIQHTELMEVHGISWGGDEDFEEHVSAV